MVRLNRRIAALKPSATMAAEARATELKAQGVDVISLAAGEPDFDTPERIKDAARRALAEGRTKYTQVTGTPELKDAIRLKLRRDNHLDYDRSEVMASAGSKQATAMVICALFDEGDEVIVPTPAWVSYAAMISVSGARPLPVRCEEGSGFRLDPQALRNALTERTRGIILNSPCNPTGAAYGPEDLAQLAQVILAAKLWVISDDVYEHIVYDGPVRHLLLVEPGLRSRAIIVNSVSKSYAMTGWRIGFAAGPSEVIAAASRLQGQTSGNPNSIAQAAAVEALTGPQDDVAKMVAEFRARRAVVLKGVRALKGVSLPNDPAGAFYVFPNVSALMGRSFEGYQIADGDSLAGLLLEKANVALVGGNAFGASDHVRLSYATSMGNLAEAFKRMAPVLEGLAS